jgi:hypothetical protein
MPTTRKRITRRPAPRRTTRPVYRKPNARARGAKTVAPGILASWREMMPPGTVFYPVVRTESPTSNRAVVDFYFLAPTAGRLGHLPSNAVSGLTEFSWRDGSGARKSGAVLPNGWGDVQDFVEALAESLHGDRRAFPSPRSYL